MLFTFYLINILLTITSSAWLFGPLLNFKCQTKAIYINQIKQINCMQPQDLVTFDFQPTLTSTAEQIVQSYYANIQILRTRILQNRNGTTTYRIKGIANLQGIQQNQTFRITISNKSVYPTPVQPQPQNGQSQLPQFHDQYGDKAPYDFSNAIGILIAEQLRFGILDILDVRNQLRSLNNINSKVIYNYLKSGPPNKQKPTPNVYVNTIYREWQKSSKDPNRNLEFQNNPVAIIIPWIQ